jgi:hypothetical protein
MAVEEWERAFTGVMGPVPRGCWRGRWLGWLDTPGARVWHVRVADTLLFRALTFGVDFDRRRWWFVHPRLGAGRFRISAGRSRWRDTDALRLEYDVSRLPVRHILYDEIKPLPDGRCLGLGGINAERGQGDHFFFELTPR